jgi:tetratricopeptide (TPR) repeat protein
MSARSRVLWSLVPTLIAGFALVWQLQRQIDVQRAAFANEEDDVVVRSAKLTKIASMEFAPLMADVYWTQAVQYYGNKHLRSERGLDLLWPYIDIATTLDPNLIPAYEFGATFLGEAEPAGAGRPDLAVQLIERGIRENPDRWRFYANLGYIYYFDVQDYAKASNAFLEGSKRPGALEWMKVMAARIAAIGNSLETSKFLWMEIYQSSKDENIKKNAMTHLQLLKVDEDCQALDKVNEEYAAKTGHRAKTTKELVAAGMLRGIAADPLGYPYAFGENGLATLNPASPLVHERRIISPKKPLLQ